MEISGGSSVKRHIVNPMDYTISLFINLFSENGYKDTVISVNLTDKTLYESNFINKNKVIKLYKIAIVVINTNTNLTQKTLIDLNKNKI